MKFENRVQRVKDLVDVRELLIFLDLDCFVQEGPELKMLCPFHVEKAPSFTFNVIEKVYHCFGCNEGGDVISFVGKVKDLDFKEALTFLEDFIKGNLQYAISMDDRILRRDSLIMLIKKAKLRIDSRLDTLPKASAFVKMCMYVDLSFSYFLFLARLVPESDLCCLRRDFLHFFSAVLKKISDGTE